MCLIPCVYSPALRLAFNAESAFISVVAAPLAMVAVTLLSMPVAVGVEITASLDVLEMDRPVSSGVFKSLGPASDGKAYLQAKALIASKAHVSNYNTRLYYQSLNKTLAGLTSFT